MSLRTQQVIYRFQDKVNRTQNVRKGARTFIKSELRQSLFIIDEGTTAYLENENVSLSSFLHEILLPLTRVFFLSD